MDNFVLTLRNEPIETATATPELRWRGGVLQQCWLVHRTQNGDTDVFFRWEAVPTVDAAEDERP